MIRSALVAEGILPVSTDLELLDLAKALHVPVILGLFEPSHFLCGHVLVCFSHDY